MGDGDELKGEALLVHVITGVVLDSVPLSQVSAVPHVLEGQFVAPECWLGGGLYTIHIRAFNYSGSLFSEFWPRLVVHWTEARSAPATPLRAEPGCGPDGAGPLGPRHPWPGCASQ